MDAVRLGEGRWELDDLVERAEAGETIEIMRGERIVAKLTPAAKSGKTVDLAAIRRVAETLAFDPRNSVEEMRKQARY